MMEAPVPTQETTRPGQGLGSQNDGNTFINRILEKIDNLTTLEIHTIIGKATVDPMTKKVVPIKDAKVITTRIDLLQGDITTVFNEEFLQEPLDKVRQYHLEREKQGQQMIEGNLKALKELITLVVNATKSQGEVKS